MNQRTYTIDEKAFSDWNSGRHRDALEAWDYLLDDCKDLPDSDRPRIEKNRRFAIQALDHTFSQYPCDVVDRLVQLQEERARRPERRAAFGVTLTILSCKRYDLFTRTVNSFLKHCTDLELISRWICVDDNSHPNERHAMKAIYPFFEFVFKDPKDTGHAKSLNILRGMVTTPYVFALEDDWLFVRKMDFVSRALRVFEGEPESVKQVLINRHYVEIPDDAYLSVTGGIAKKDLSGKRYILHEYFSPKSAEYTVYCSKHRNNFAHQPHFALRPSLFKTEIWETLGGFNESPDVDFEATYAQSYQERGYVSAYFDGIYAIHIGRLNRDKHDPNARPNAYQLNQQPQYGKHWETNRCDRKKLEGERLILTVTTCKRLVPFLKSMRTTLSMCKDIHMVDKFLVVDDNSSEEDRQKMMDAFPFFEFILKSHRDKGHAKSMNVILDKARDYDYVFHTEDDWDFRSQYSLGDAIVLLRETGVGQVILRWHEFCRAKSERFNGITYRAHNHDLFDTNIPGFFAEWRKGLLTEQDRVLNETSLGGCWWPTFSLNPSVFDARKVLELGERFDEDMDPTYFEYAFSFRLWRSGFRVCMFETEMSQYPHKTAYLLNDHLRSFDSRGCEVHRAMNGNTDCTACVEQKKGFAALRDRKM